MSNNNLALLDSIISDYKKDNFPQEEIHKDKVFEIFATDKFFNNLDFSIDDIKGGLIGGTNDWGVDGIYILIAERNINNIEELEELTLLKNFKIDLYVFQYKNSTNFKENVIDNFLTIGPYISDLEKKEKVEAKGTISQDVLEKITLFHKILTDYASKHPSVNINFIHASRGDTDNIYGKTSAGKKINENKKYLQKIEDLNEIIISNALGGKIKFEYKLLGSEELKNLSQYEKSYSGKLKLNENPIFVEYGEEGSQEGYLATVYLSDYFDFLVEVDEEDNKRLKEYLFESNIRDYQNNTAVNKDIETTLKNSEKEEDFWWLNNGITILADEGSIIGKTFTLENIQIVNGLQTSYSIYHALKDIDYKNDKRTVFCKVIITSNDKSRDSIIKATNSQNNVPLSSLRSTDIIQRDIEIFLLQRGLYYDRRKNYYKNQGKPISKIISINYLAQAITAIVLREPAKARSSPTILTKKDQDYKIIFNKDVPIQIYYHAALLRMETERKIKKELKSRTSSLEKGINSYFQLHLLRIVSSILVGKVKITTQDLKELNDDKILDIQDDVITDSIDILKELLLKIYMSKGEDNLANISKNSKINKEISEHIELFLEKVNNQEDL